MAIMTAEHWKKQTARMLRKRSDELRAIDDALEAYHTKKGTPTLTSLVKAIEDWLKLKGNNWKASIRNSKLEAGGKGTVETLIDEVIKLLPAAAVTFNKYTSKPKMPVGQVMKNGALTNQKDIDGNWHALPIQAEGNSCGPACLRIVSKLVNNDDIGEDFIRELYEAAEEDTGYVGSLGTGGILESGGAHNWDDDGTSMTLMPKMLGAFNKPIKAEFFNYNQPLIHATKSKPVVLRIGWSDGSGHFVVTTGFNRARNRIIILDPWYGTQSITCDGSTIGDYKPIRHSDKKVLGTGEVSNFSVKLL